MNIKDIEALLLKEKGVVDVALIELIHREKIIDLENRYEKNGVVGLQNLGIRMVVQRDFVLAILKDISFRPPPGPTVYMVEECKRNNNTVHLLEVNNTKYSIIGEELINKKLPKEEEYMYISDDFILYPERRKGQTDNPAYFLIPPLGFSELEEVKETFNIKNIISVSPSTMSDDFIRKQFGFSVRYDCATILIGFDKTR